MVSVEAIDIPAELWIEVHKHQEPKDALSLSQVSRLAYGSLHRRDVWVTILRSVCHKYGLFLPSYPVHDMNLAHLQRAALGPYLWSKSIRKHSSDTSPALGPFTPYTKTPLINPDMCPDDYYLVPGGRYLITARKETYSLELLDIGVAGRPQFSPPRLLSQVYFRPMEESSTLSLRVQSVGEDRLRVFIIGLELGRLEIYEIVPGDEQPTFQIKLSTVGEAVSMWEIQHYGDRILCSLPSTENILMDLTTRRTIKWPFWVDTNGRSIFMGDLLLQFSEEALYVWDAPPLSEAATPFQVQTNRLRADLTIYSPFPASGGYNMIFYFPVAPQLPFIFDVFYTPGEYSMITDAGPHPTTASRYKIDVVRSPDPERKIIDVELEVLATFSFPLPGVYVPHKAPDSNFEFGFSSMTAFRDLMRDVTGIYSLVPTAGGGPTMNTGVATVPFTHCTHDVLLTEFGPIARPVASGVSTCSASGRMVYPVGGNTLYIAEYSPP